MADTGTNRVVLAAVTGGHGTRGEVRLKIFAEDPAAIGDYGPLERSDGGAPLEVVGLHPVKNGVVARFAGVTDRNAAEALKGVELSVPRDRLPEPEPDEFYFTDLIGLAAVRPDGTELGEVIAVHNFGAGDVVEVQFSGTLETILVPFTREAVPEIDVAARRLVIDPPEGLLEE